jgi:hypothetical protein
MIELIEGAPRRRRGFEAIGEVESADYVAIAAPAVNWSGIRRFALSTSSTTASPALRDELGCGAFPAF